MRIVRSAPESIQLHVAAWWIDSDVDLNRLSDAIRTVVESAPILRTVYRVDRSAPRAAVRPTPEHPLQLLDPADDGPLDADDILAAEGRQSIDLASQPAIRVRVHRGADRGLLTVAVHPAAADERSFARIIEGIGSAYAGAATLPAGDDGALDDGAGDDRASDNRTADRGTADFWADELSGLSAETVADRTPRRPSGPVVDRRVAELTSAIPVDAEQDVRVAALVAGAAFDEWGLADQVIGLVDVADVDAIGPVDHLVPLRIRIDGGQTPRELISTVAATVARAREHRASARRALRSGPIPIPVHIALSVHTDPPPVLRLGADLAEPVAYRTSPAPGADVSIVVRPNGRTRTVEVTFPGALAGRHDARGFAERLVDLARIWAAGPERPLAHLPRAGEPHSTLLGEPLDRAEPLGFPFWGAPLRPLRPALRTTGGELTFEALADRAERLADDLVLAGVVPGDVVAVATSDPVIRIVTLIAVLRVGAGCALLERDTLRAGRSGIDAALAASRASVVVDAGADGAIETRAVTGAVSSTDPSAPAGDASPTALIFLAPSRTRVVGLDRRHLEDRVRALIPEAPVSPREQVATETSAGVEPERSAVETVVIAPEIGSAESCAMALAVLVADGTLVLPEPDERADPVRLGEVVTRSGAGHLVAAPTTIADMMAHRALPGDLVRLTLVAEPVRSGLLGGVRTALPRTRIATAYSVADAGGAGLIGVLVDPGGDASIEPAVAVRRAGILGTPVPGMGVRILDDRGRAVPIGVVGEIHLIRDCATVPTGDRGLWSSDGEVVGVGRAAVDVVADGRPVRVDALESLLGAIDGVLAAAVVLRPVGQSTQVGALLLPQPGADVARILGQARAELIETVAGPSIEYTLETVATLPVTGTGALDRIALAAGGSQSLRAATGSGGAAATSTEQLVAEAFAAALDPPLEEPVGRTDGFFAIGGDSLAALRLIARL
ncbi:AMP-binding protein, partial [Millisia brevis]|uniref:AMP-binding protein n=1 Tax=Millisia brevis TaxID=264148 RepID=UPI0014725209